MVVGINRLSKGMGGNGGKSGGIDGFVYRLTIGYISILIVCIMVISFVIIQKTNDTLIDKVQSFLTALNVQMQINIDNYLEKLEVNGTLIFSDEDIYTYTPLDDTISDYDKVTLENDISSKLFEFSITENFCDYGIVYSNNHTVGKISNATTDLTEGNMYEYLEQTISREGTNDGWCSNLNGDFKRLYYVKQINPNAILLTSFYTAHLEDVFKHLDYMNDMTIEIINEEDQLMYSSIGHEVGTKLSDDILDRIGDKVSTSILDDEYLISVNSCGDDWRIVLYIPTKTILEDNSSTVVFICILSCAICVVSIVATVLLFKNSSMRIQDTVHGLIKKADFDQLTEILNKNSFREHTDYTLSRSSTADQRAFLMLDVDNFKGVNDNLGHIYGDRVLSNVGAILRSNFPMSEHIVGRLGGDEFAVFISVPDGVDATEYVSGKCSSVCKDFSNNYSGENHDYKISASIGVSLYPKHGKTFEELYHSADVALYHSKHEGKDTYTVYDETLENGGE